MKRIILCLFSLLTSAGLLSAQTSNDVNEGSQLNFDNSTGAFTFSWWGRAGRTYFIQHSDDLHQWNYVPIIESGSDQIISWGFTSTTDKFFIRMKYMDITISDSSSSDFDGDGISNADELAQGTDPLSAIFDINGLPVDWEKFYNIPAGIDATQAAPRGDGLSYMDAFTQRLNPNDFYDGKKPIMNIVSGANQTGLPDNLLSKALIVLVTDTSGSPLKNAPVTFSIADGGGSLSLNGWGELLPSLSVCTNRNGIAQAFLQLGSDLCQNIVNVSTGNGQSLTQVIFTANCISDSAPAAPSYVRCIRKSPTEVLVEWDDNSDNETAFYVERSEDNQSWQRIASLPANTTSFADTTLTEGLVYLYRIVSHN